MLKLRDDQVADLAVLMGKHRHIHGGDPGCVDASTEFLTPIGWVRFRDFDESVHREVAQYHPDTGNISFTKDRKFVKLPCDRMLHFKTKYGINQMLSPEHRMLISYKGKIETTLAALFAAKGDRMQERLPQGEGIPYNRARCPTVFNYSGGAGIGLSEIELRLQIVVIADGHFKKDRNTNWCTVSLKKERKIYRLETLLKNSSMKYTKVLQSGYTRFRFYAPIKTKIFDSQFWKASREELKIIADEVLHWDGSKNNLFFSRVKQNVDFVQFVFNSLGHTARITYQTRKEGVDYTLTIRPNIKEVGFSGSDLLNNRRSANYSWVVPEDGFKYCFMVPSSYLVFRREGCVFASGNTGKTPTICVNQAIRWRQHGFGTVWPMPKKLMGKNYDEAMAWGGWNEGDVIIVDGTPKQVLEQLKPGPKVYIMGFTRFEKVWNQLPDYVKAIDIDEFHKGFSGVKSKRTQALYQFCSRPEVHFVPMTGTILNGKPSSVYPALQIIEPRYYGTPELFDKVHNVVDPWTGKVIGYRNLEALGDILRKHTIQRRWRDVHGDRKRVYQLERVDMAPKQREMYQKFEKTALLELEQFFIDGTEPGVNFIRARQIMEHPNCFPDLRDPKLPPINILPEEVPAKLETLELDLINAVENKTPIVVFASLVPQQNEILALMKSMGLRAGILNGNTSVRDTNELDRDFREGRLNGLVASDLVADCGFNWQYCGDQEVSDVVFQSLGYNDTTFHQALGRFERKARVSALRVKVRIYRRSLDERVLQIVCRKSREANQVDPNREIISFDGV